MTDSPFLCLLAEYVSPDEHIAHAQFAELVSEFHFKRAASIRARKAGNVPRAQLYENEAARLSREIEDNLAASARAIEAEAALLTREIENSAAAAAYRNDTERDRAPSLDELPSLVFAQREREVADDGAE